MLLNFKISLGDYVGKEVARSADMVGNICRCCLLGRKATIAFVSFEPFQHLKTNRMDMQSFLKVGSFLQIIAAPATAQGAVGYGMTSGRAAALLPVAVGLISVVIGGLALRSAWRIGSGKRGAILTLIVGSVGMLLSILHLVRSSGGIGTGSGKLGAIVALVLGAIGAALGWMALARSRRIAKRGNNPTQ